MTCRSLLVVSLALVACGVSLQGHATCPPDPSWACPQGGIVLAADHDRRTLQAPTLTGTDSDVTRVEGASWRPAGASGGGAAPLIDGPVRLQDESGRDRWQVVPAVDPETAKRLPMTARREAGGWSFETLGPGPAPTMIDLDDTPFVVHGVLPQVVADVNGDGVTDVVALVRVAPFPDPAHPEAQVILGERGGRGFVDAWADGPDARVIGMARATWKLFGADVNGDGIQDLIVRASDDPKRLEVHLGPFGRGEVRDTRVEEPSATWLSADGHLSDVRPGDVNGDGRADVVVADSSGHWFVIFGADPPVDLDLADPDPAGFARLVLPDPAGFGGLEPLDLDGDGVDEIVAKQTGPALRVLTERLREPGIVEWTGEDDVVIEGLPFAVQRLMNIPGACGRERAIVSDPLALSPQGFLVETRPRRLWASLAEPDLLVRTPPPERGGSSTPALLVEDFNGDGFRDIAAGMPGAADPDRAVAGPGLVVVAAMGPNTWGEVDITSRFTRLIVAPAGEREFGPALFTGDADGDGIADLFVQSRTARLPIFTRLRAYRGGPRFGDPLDLGCEQLTRLDSGDETTFDGTAAEPAFAAWGRVEPPTGSFDAVMRREPDGEARPGDPTLLLDEVPFADDVVEAPVDPPRGYRGRVERAAAGALTARVPFAAGADGALFACLEPASLPPLVEAGEDQLVATGPDDEDCAVEVNLSGAAYERECDPMNVHWELDGARVADGVEAVVTLPLGLHELTLVAADIFDEARDSLAVEVVDATPPRLELEAPEPCLWAPNHRWVDVRLGEEIAVGVEDNCDPAPTVRIVEVTSDEEELGPGSGHHAPDVRRVGDDHVRLRVERSGRGEGRAYAVVVEAEDAAGNVTREVVELLVPHDRSRRARSPCGRGARRGRR